MIKNRDQDIIDEIESFELSAKSRGSFIPEITAATNSITNETHINDDLIASLSAAYENKRARQVFNWERMRIHTVERST